MQTQIKSLTDSECEMFLNPVDCVWHMALLILMLDTGVRVGELVRLKASDLWYMDSPASMLQIRAEIAKNKQLRTIPVSSRLHEQIILLHRHHWPADGNLEEYFAFHSFCCNVPLSCRTVQRLVLSYGQATLHRRVTPHMLRHTFATRLMRKCSIRVVQQLLGHSSLQSTQIYTTPNNQDLQNAIDSLNERSKK